MSLKLNDLRVLLSLQQSNMVQDLGQPTSMAYASDLYVLFSDGSTPYRAAALIAETPYII